MRIHILDREEEDDKYVIFRDAKYIYVVHENHAHMMQKATPGGSVRIHTADIIIEPDTGKVIKSRFSPPFRGCCER